MPATVNCESPVTCGFNSSFVSKFDHNPLLQAFGGGQPLLPGYPQEGHSSLVQHLMMLLIKKDNGRDLLLVLAPSPTLLLLQMPAAVQYPSLHHHYVLSTSPLHTQYFKFTSPYIITTSFCHYSKLKTNTHYNSSLHHHYILSMLQSHHHYIINT